MFITDPIFLLYSLTGIFTLAVLAWMATVYLRYKIRTPVAGWLDIVKVAKQTGAPIPASVRSPPLRRQLILASRHPAQLSNFRDMAVDSIDVKKLGQPTQRRIFGFLHPNASAGGGGERVLWAAVKQTLQNDNNIAAIYMAARKGLTLSELLEHVYSRFGISFTPSEANRIVIIGLTQTNLINPETFPWLTLVGQAFGMAVLGYEAISNLMPDVFVETTGLAFCYPVVSWIGCVPVLSYVHYPFVQHSMIQTLKWWSPKQLYWRLLLVAYRFALKFSSVTTSNSTWTSEHLLPIKSDIVFPPCAVQDFHPSTEQRTPAIVYVAQFRPEKRHEIVLKAFSRVKSQIRKVSGQRPHLIFIGSVRDEDDAIRVLALRRLATELGLTEHDCTIVENAPWPNVRRILETSLVGLNAMWNEHFGMGVVEIMAAGLIPVVHASAGPLLDIVKNTDHGFFFKSARDPDYKKGEYPSLSEALLSAFSLNPADRKAMSLRVQAASQKFGDAQFATAWEKEVEKSLKFSQESSAWRKKKSLFD